MEDLGRVVYHNDGRLDVVEGMARSTREELQRLITELDKRAETRDRSRFERLAIAAACLSPVVTLALGVIYHGH